MENTSGFYRVGVASSVFFYAPNMVIFPDGIVLTKTNKNNYVYPVNNWVWYESIEDAYQSQGMTPPKPPEKIENRRRRNT